MKDFFVDLDQKEAREKSVSKLSLDDLRNIAAMLRRNKTKNIL